MDGREDFVQALRTLKVSQPRSVSEKERSTLKNSGDDRGDQSAKSSRKERLHGHCAAFGAVHGA